LEAALRSSRGNPPLLAGEDQAQYEAMRDQISAAVGPFDFLEEIWVNDVVNLVWETLRLRRLRAALLHAAAPDYFYRVFSNNPDYCAKLERNWTSREPDVVAQVDTDLAAGGLTRDRVMAGALASSIGEVERIDRMVASAEARRNVALREIDRHRATLGAALRQAGDEVLDAEFTEIPLRLTEGEAGVTSARKIRANRANAGASSGPKTAAGKAQSAQNAFRHGFNVPVWLDPDLASDVEAFAQRIVGKSTDADVLESARRVAEAQIDLRRVRSHRTRLIERAMADPMFQTEAAEPAPFEAAAARIGSDVRGRALRADPFEEKVSALVAEFAKNFAALDRYERRALSRRRTRCKRSRVGGMSR
jgi:hypothetical protein